MKRKNTEVGSVPQIKNGAELIIRSFNYPDYEWGHKCTDRCLSIVKRKDQRMSFTLSMTSAGLKSVSLSVHTVTDRYNVEIDEDSLEVVLGSVRSHISIEVLETFSDTAFIGRFVTKSGFWLRHSNYLLRADPPGANDRNLEEDSRWIISLVRTVCESPESTAPGTPNSVTSMPPPLTMTRPIFIYIPDCQACFSRGRTADHSSKHSIQVMVEYLESLLELSVSKPRSSRYAEKGLDVDSVMSYMLQGAGGMSMDAQATAISTYPPHNDVPDGLVERIEGATTVKSRGGVKSFLSLPDEVSGAISRLSKFALSHMRRKRMFGMIPKARFHLELGFCEWITLPNGSEIVPHRDGGNDCDVAAIFALYNSAFVSVEGSQVRLDAGQMYIFEPQKYTHSVSKPLLEGPRHAVALRFFRRPITN